MLRALLLSVRFYDGRYHGVPDWPPSPARLFQALLAGAAQSRTLTDDDKHAFAWLETLTAPVIAAPVMRHGQDFTNYVPNNDLDAVGGDQMRVDKIRAPKPIRPILFDAETPLLYTWTFEEAPEAHRNAQRIRAIAQRLYQLGRGVDMAWAVGEIPTPEVLDMQLASHPGPIHCPSTSGSGTSLSCPQRGSLESLLRRHEAAGTRFKTLYAPAPTKKEPGRTKPVGQSFSQPPKPRFAQVAYDSPPQRPLFDLREPASVAPFVSWPQTRTAALVAKLRDAAAARLKKALPENAALIERVLVGRGATEVDKATRVRILPLPSIGHAHADHAIRRVLVEIPPNCPIPADDVAWSFSGLDLGINYQTGEVLHESQPLLMPADDRAMLHHYGIEEPTEARLWRTVTPSALPRRYFAVSRTHRAKRGAIERLREEDWTTHAVVHALRHAGINARVESICVQQEPFAAKGARAEAFAPATRFAKERLWHVEMAFAEAMRGPLILGDGRYLGLGLMAPVKDSWRDVMAFSLPADAHVPVAGRADLLRAVRRALMALSRNSRGDVPRLFSGHDPDGAPASSGGHEHVFLAADDADGDGRIDRLIVAAPWICDRLGRVPGQSDRALFDRVVSSLAEVRAGKLGVISLGLHSTLAAADPVFGTALTWESRTPYRPTRHAGRGKDPAVAVAHDVINECEHRGLPKPEVDLLEFSAGPNGGNLAARVHLRFAVAVKGPIMLGRDSHIGGGLFAAVDE